MPKVHRNVMLLQVSAQEPEPGMGSITKHEVGFRFRIKGGSTNN